MQLENYQTQGGFVQVPADDFAEILARLKEVEIQEDLEARAALDHALANPQEFLPGDVAKRIILDEESPMLVFREYRGLTQKQLAAKIGKTTATISEIETGRTRGDVDTLKAIADALDITVDDLI